jgi:ABC-type thiamin/hydroxymethylpyrimidine transport system permease subunit/DMSO/TMAO reductase YedYZ molybdopterin-dependent catalytic subunit
MKERRLHFSTRDLLMMAALAALGGVTSTYVNAIGDLFQSVLGFAGTTQWAAGLHVLWLTLAVGLTRKQGAGTVTGILKGGVELLTGNTHGLLVVLIDVAAGLLVDVGFLPFRNKDSLPAYGLAGGLAAASNVLVFQLFAAVPADTLAYWAMLLVAGVALLSGVLFGGVLSRALVSALRRAGVVKDRPAAPLSRRVYLIALGVVALLAAALTFYLRGALQGPATVRVGGVVEAPYEFPLEHGDIAEVTREGTLRELTSRYTGVPLRELVELAKPAPGAALLLIRASDGYAFFLSMDELRSNDSLLLAAEGERDEVSYSVVGAASSKAWVRGVSELEVVGSAALGVVGSVEQPGVYDPSQWLAEMDSTTLDLGGGAVKVQGVALGNVIQTAQPRDDATEVLLYGAGAPLALPLADVLGDDNLRVFTVIGNEGVSFAVAGMDGAVLATDVARVEVR